ncbi:MAG: Na(+)-translocating NADH-quinone reductase subunit A [Gammaproteobacteria bacterium]
MIKITKGLDLPIKGKPEQVVRDEKTTQTVAVLGGDYPGLKPALAVEAGDRVEKGRLLFTDKTLPGVRITAPAAGRVKAINRGERRVLQSIEIELEGSGQIEFESYRAVRTGRTDREKIVRLLLESGLWTALRARPFGRVADPSKPPHSLFVTAMDTNPLAPSLDSILKGKDPYFADGVRLISRLTDGPLFLCKSPGTAVPEMDIDNLFIHDFSGPHPAGNVGTHIHFLDPVRRGKTVWHIGLQDAIAVGRLFAEGELDTARVVSLAGPGALRPRLCKTLIGASLDDLTAGELKPGEQRILSGSPLSGFHARGPTAYLGRYHQQVAVLPEDRRREPLGWLSPGFDRFSVKRIVASRFLPKRLLDFTTSTYGETRAIIPSGNYERVMPLDVLPLFLIRALAVGDIEEAERLGCLELDEEDLALCAYVCPSKQEFGPLLRAALTAIEEEEADV